MNITFKEVVETVHNIVCNSFGIDTSDIGISYPIGTYLDANSLDCMEIRMDIETRYDISIPDSALSDIAPIEDASIEDVANMVFEILIEDFTIRK